LPVESVVNVVLFLMRFVLLVFCLWFRVVEMQLCTSTFCATTYSKQVVLLLLLLHKSIHRIRQMTPMHVSTIFLFFLYTGQLLVHFVPCCILPDCCKLHIVHITFVF